MLYCITSDCSDNRNCMNKKSGNRIVWFADLVSRGNIEHNSIDVSLLTRENVNVRRQTDSG